MSAALKERPSASVSASLHTEQRDITSNFINLSVPQAELLSSETLFKRSALQVQRSSSEALYIFDFPVLRIYTSHPIFLHIVPRLKADMQIHGAAAHRADPSLGRDQSLLFLVLLF